MTVSYSLDVSKARFCGLAKLLARWKGGIYKILWREFCIFCLAYTFVSVTYRNCLNENQKVMFEKLVMFVEASTNLIPLSFVLGFYVSLIIGRWWGQYETIPWPDRLCFLISSYVHGSDQRSRMIRRTLGRYMILAMAITFQCVSTSVKRRFPTTRHLVDAGIMTKEEQSVFEKISFHHGKWWLPCHWFSALATRARKEGRIKDSLMLNGLLSELMDYRTSCAIMFGYDWISVPLVYTQVVTIATYVYCFALILGRQYLDPSKGYPTHDIDMYIPFFTLLQFFFYVGWLKVAEQILNPYGEDDDDFELNWCLDRAIHIVYFTVDTHHLKHPKLTKDFFWDEEDPILPQTKRSSQFFLRPELGSAFNLEVEEAEYVPMESLLEPDTDGNTSRGNSVRRKEEYRPSLIRRILSKRFRPTHHQKPPVSISSSIQGFTNPSYEINEKNTVSSQKSLVSTPTSSLNNAVKTSPSPSRNSSISFRPNSLSLHKRRSYDLRDAERVYRLECLRSAPQSPTKHVAVPVARTASAPIVASQQPPQFSEKFLEPDRDDRRQGDDPMPSIAEESARVDDINSKERQHHVQDLMDEVHKVLKELNRTLSAADARMSENSNGYESCCSGTEDEDPGLHKVSKVLRESGPDDEDVPVFCEGVVAIDFEKEQTVSFTRSLSQTINTTNDPWQRF